MIKGIWNYYDKKKELENNRPQDIDAMRRWKHSMGKILQELELFH